MPLFRKNVKFTVVKPAAEKQEEAKTISEPENKPAEVTNEVETEEQKKLNSFMEQWARELTRSAGYRTPNTTIVEGKPYYVLRCEPNVVRRTKANSYANWYRARLEGLPD